MLGRVPSYVKGSHMTYVVEVRQPPSYQWNTLVDDIEDTEFDIYDLQPDQDYMFRIRARNEFGMSDPTMSASVIRSKGKINCCFLCLSLYKFNLIYCQNKGDNSVILHGNVFKCYIYGALTFVSILLVIDLLVYLKACHQYSSL